MATVLSDKELKGLIGSVIINGDESCVRPNAYILRLGSGGEFKNINKPFSIGDAGKRGIKLASGHAAGLSSYEQLDFSRETVHKIYPDCDLFAYMSPVTDLSREGVTTQTTQVDADFKGILTWTINNTSNEENQFMYKEKLYRLTVFKLDQNEEKPEKPYDGDYQGQKDYVRSTRKGAPRGMKDDEWETSAVEGSPENHLAGLISSGFPWSLLGKQLKKVDGELKEVTEGYFQIDDSLKKIKKEIEGFPDIVEDKINQKKPELVFSLGGILAFFASLGVAVIASDSAIGFLKNYGAYVSLGIIGVLLALYIFANKK